MNAETRACQNCKADFTIEPEDFEFYQKVNVAPPTFCFDCRVQRRMAFRNERVLYKRKCGAPGHDETVISIFSPDKKQRVYDHAAWWGDSWSPLDYGRDVDFSRPFFAQLKELWAEVPDVAVLNINPVNSEYCSITEGNKNCYLVFGGDFNEDTLYSTYVFRSKECMDTYWVQKSDRNYETVDCTSCSRLSHARYCEGCYGSAFLFNCRNCHDCLGCVNLVNKSYCIFNVQYSKGEYFEKIKEFNLGSFSEVEKLKERFAAHALGFPRRFAKMIQIVNSSGDNLENCKNCKQCFDIFEGGEDCSRVFLSYSKSQNCMDSDRMGLSTELVIDSSGIYPGSRVSFSRFVFTGHDAQYSYNCHNSSYIFGCVGLRNKQYCIFNKQYAKEEYETLVPKIIEHMRAMPYIDVKGRIYKDGEFFPIELSPFCYNETIAQEMYPLTKEEAISQGYAWKDDEEKAHVATKRTEDMPDAINEVSDAMLNETFECSHQGNCNDQCTKAFRIVPVELEFYRRMNIPLPRLCQSCRHFARVRQRNPMKLWARTCQCGGAESSNRIYKNLSQHSHGDLHCSNAFETTYNPDRPEIVYCERCYQAEVS
jgi:hypothetical protein